MILCFDLETTGLPTRKKGFGNYHPPTLLQYYKDCRICEIAWILFDKNGNIHAQNQSLIKPQQWTVPAEATKIHGTTTAECQRVGQDLTSVVQAFAQVLEGADRVMGHNIPFDVHVLASEMHRLGLSSLSAALMTKIRINTMTETHEPLSKMFAARFPAIEFKAHRAMGDVVACASIHFGKIVPMPIQKSAEENKVATIQAKPKVATIQAKPKVTPMKATITKLASLNLEHTTEVKEAVSDISEITEIELSRLHIGDENVRKNLTDEETSVLDLAQDIQQHGLLHPLTVRPTTGGQYTIVAGQRRYLALRSLGRLVAPCRVVELSDDVAEEISLTENVQRAQLTTSDKVRTYNRLYSLYGNDIGKLSKKVSVTQSTLKKYIKIASLPEEILDRLDGKGDGKITLDTAEELSKLPQEIVKEAAEAISRLPTNAARADAVRQINKTPDADFQLIVDEVSVRSLEKIKLAPTSPWIFGRDKEPLIIPAHLYESILDIIEEDENT
jgi:ParB/RepB/Spo0J family partition protein